MGTKLCRICTKKRLLKFFNKSLKSPDGLHPYCRSCQSAYYQKNRVRYLERVKANNRRYYLANRALVREAKSKPCADCGKSYPYYVMDLDHVGDAQKVTEVSGMLRFKLEDLQQEIAKCEAVCSNCHRERTYKRSCLAASADFLAELLTERTVENPEFLGMVALAEQRR